ncbi:MAG TPA: hydroxymethylglutaryl-CoA lyase [Actinomycetota bacterium]
MRDLPKRVTIREVGPRDGLQSESPVAVEDRARLITLLSTTGVPEIEAVSFVSPKAVPSMANAADVWGRVERNPTVRYSALVPNRKGAEAALAAGGFDSLQAFLAASDGYNQANVGKPVDESIRDVADVVSVAREAEMAVEVSISAAFGDPYEGDVEPGRVLGLAEKLLSVGVSGFSLGDTTGMATPTRVWTLLEILRDRLPAVRLNLHFHDTRGAAMANVLAALEMGCDDFDSSIGGIGGSPFAPGAGGNVSTEDLAHMLTDMGVETGIESVEGLLEVSEFLRGVLGHPLKSEVLAAGPRWTRSEKTKVD